MAKVDLNKVEKEIMVDAVNGHAEALIKRRTGLDTTPFISDADAAELYRLNKNLYLTLTPVEPSESFVDQLKMQLMSAHAGNLHPGQIRATKNRKLLRTAFSIFTVLSVIARIVASVLVVLAIMSRRRRASAAAAA